MPNTREKLYLNNEPCQQQDPQKHHLSLANCSCHTQGPGRWPHGTGARWHRSIVMSPQEPRHTQCGLLPLRPILAKSCLWDCAWAGPAVLPSPFWISPQSTNTSPSLCGTSKEFTVLGHTQKHTHVSRARHGTQLSLAASSPRAGHRSALGGAGSLREEGPSKLRAQG